MKELRGEAQSTATNIVIMNNHRPYNEIPVRGNWCLAPVITDT